MILYIGNKLSKHGATPTTVETLGNLLSKQYDMILISDKKNKVLRMLDIIFFILRYRKSIDLILIDTYSTTNFYYALITAFLSKIFDIPYIPILHGGSLKKRLQKNPFFSKYLFKYSAVNVSPSLYLKTIFEKYDYHVKHIPNNIVIENYPFKLRKHIEAKLLFVRSFHTMYNPMMAIEVLKKLLNDYDTAELCMVGPDKDGSMQEVQKLARELGVEDRLIITGRLDKKEWIALSEQYDIFINTTNFDNQPVSIIEAMALGMPVVSTNAGGLPYLIKTKVDGILVEKNDVKAMVRNIIKLIQNSKPHIQRRL